MKILSSILAFSITFSSMLAFASEDELYFITDTSYEVLTNPVTLRDGRTVKDRLRICTTGLQCRVFVIKNENHLAKVTDIVEAVNSGRVTGGVLVVFNWDQDLKELKYLESLKTF